MVWWEYPTQKSHETKAVKLGVCKKQMMTSSLYNVSRGVGKGPGEKEFSKIKKIFKATP